MKIAFILLTCILFIRDLWCVNLFDEISYQPLVADHRARLPGDLLTVIVMETSNAQTSTDLSSGKQLKTALQASYNKNQFEAGVGLRGEGRTAAKTGRNGKIKASLSVRIKELLPNRSYLVEGRQVIKINGEQQNILLSGWVREEDISSQNTILSTRLADAAISYSGNGQVSDSERRNYPYRLLSFLGLV